MTAAEECAGPDWTAGHALIARMAATGRIFTSNEIRSELRALGFSRFDSGALFMQAKAEGVIRKVGVEASTDAPTHGAYVRRWTGAPSQIDQPAHDAVVVPVHRDSSGRFASPGFQDVPLFEVGAG